METTFKQAEQDVHTNLKQPPMSWDGHKECGALQFTKNLKHALEGATMKGFDTIVIFFHMD